MPYIPYLPQDLAEPREAVEATRKRRGGTLQNLDRMLLYSGPLALGWGALMSRVRGEFSLPDKLRELAICTVAAATGAEYEAYHHAPIFLAAGGAPEQLAALDGLGEAPSDAALAAFDEIERAVVRLAHEVTLRVKPSTATLDAAAAALSGRQQLVELLAVIASYNMVARMLVPLDVQPE